MKRRGTLDGLLKPRSVAVIGASSRKGSIGGEIFGNLISHGFQGPVYPVHPSDLSIQSVRAYPRIADVPGPVDLAILVVPAPSVAGVVDECLEAGVKGLVVISAGFKETGAEGARLEAGIVERVRESGARLIGPNCLGILSTDPTVRLDGTFAPTFPPEGSVAIASQSGALGLAILDYARDLNIGVSEFVSMGNKADVSGNDLIDWWDRDPRTSVILLYLESFGNPRRFTPLAKRTSRRKPIVAVKSGRTARGSSAASSHTGALAGADAAVEALLAQAGVIRVDTVEQLFDMAAFLAHQPVPRGKRMAVLTNAGGPGILATDAAEAWGLTVTDLEPRTTEALTRLLPPQASVRNPVDMIASASPEQYEAATRHLLADANVDSLLVIYVPPIVTAPEEVGKAIARGATGSDKPIVSCFLGRHGVPEGLRTLEAARIPSYAFPESAVRVLRRAARYGRWLARPEGTVPTLAGVDEATVESVLETAGARGGDGWLRPDELETVLRAFGIGTPESVTAKDEEGAVLAATRLGFPVAVKLHSDRIAHKTDVGGVKLDLRTEAEVRAAAAGIRAGLRARGLEGDLDGFTVQRMIEGGVEVVVGATQDPVFGPLLMFGLGGVNVELLGDVAFRLLPFTDLDADEMIRAIRGFPLLDGYRGGAPSDLAALRDLLHRVAALIERFPRITELDLNPIKAMPEGIGSLVVDARIRVSVEKIAVSRV